jgi:transcriptional regulator with XRE-family HTH domain
MDQDKIGKFIKEIRKKNNLTQKQLANKYNVTFQAVSKWENGKNLPDITLLRQMSKDFNVNIEDILEGNIPYKENKKEENKKRPKIIKIILIIIIIFILILLCILIYPKKETFEFKTLSTSCNKFTITGSIAYSDKKSSIYISNINYCGGEDNTSYSSIECILYESNNNIDTKISTYNYQEISPIKLEEFLKDVTFHIDNYNRTCKKYSENSLYLQINAQDDNGNINSYKVPLSLSDNCESENQTID